MTPEAELKRKLEEITQKLRLTCEGLIGAPAMSDATKATLKDTLQTLLNASDLTTSTKNPVSVVSKWERMSFATRCKYWLVKYCLKFVGREMRAMHEKLMVISGERDQFMEKAMIADPLEFGSPVTVPPALPDWADPSPRSCLIATATVTLPTKLNSIKFTIGDTFKP